ncbi:MAG: protein-L-isoaspartate O-methyltransferase [Candidatus Diapherotrites archaeon]|nr:protein-L-isoaspartate O-methyltransferase [Candidatus Diapherotrites archaeon]
MNKKELLQKPKKRFPESIVKAFEAIRREQFVPEEFREHAYEDTVFPIGWGQTISQPSTLARELELLNVRQGMNVLEIGCGCGYMMALASVLTGPNGTATGIEIHKPLARLAEKNLAREKIINARVIPGDGKQGTGQKNAFERILFSCATSEIPGKIFGELKEKGILVAPVGKESQRFHVLQKTNGKMQTLQVTEEEYVFVPLR